VDDKQKRDNRNGFEMTWRHPRDGQERAERWTRTLEELESARNFHRNERAYRKSRGIA
jgi:hypothetical protein